MIRHLALIPDGNRRWAAARGLGAAEGHRAGIDTAERIVHAAFAQGVQVVSLWWGSPANLQKRSAEEEIVPSLAGLLERFQGARVSVIGRWRELCPELEPSVRRASAAQGPGHLAVLMAYDGREEIQAAKGDPAALWTAPLGPVDLVIRTGGEPHLSAGFMLWWIAEAELHFSPKLWPDFTESDLRAALEAASSRQRRFGA